MARDPALPASACSRAAPRYETDRAAVPAGGALHVEGEGVRASGGCPRPTWSLGPTETPGETPSPTVPTGTRARSGPQPATRVAEQGRVTFSLKPEDGMDEQVVDTLPEAHRAAPGGVDGYSFDGTVAIR